MSEPTARFQVRVQPGARRNEIIAVEEGVVRMRVSAPPVEGKANTAVVEGLAKALDVRISAVRLLAGATSRVKLMEVIVLTTEQALERLRTAGAGRN